MILISYSGKIKFLPFPLFYGFANGFFVFVLGFSRVVDVVESCVKSWPNYLDFDVHDLARKMGFSCSFAGKSLWYFDWNFWGLFRKQIAFIAR